MTTSAPPWTILAIDDEEDVRDVIQLALEDAGYKVFTAPEGKSGLRLCEEIFPQIVITDVRMPGMNGLEVLEAIKTRYPDIEVIVATAFGEMELAIRALQLDASDFIHKPIHIMALHTALNRAKHRYTTRKELADYTAWLEKETAETSQELIRTFQFQKNLIESSMDGILGCDAVDRIVTFNRSLAVMLAYAKTEVIGKMTLADFFPIGGADALWKELSGEKYGGPGRLYLYETEIRAKSGHLIPVQVSASLLREAGQRAGAVYFFRDLREIRRLEQEMADQVRVLHQDKMMSLGRLAASVVHEINNPLSGILNYLGLMSRLLGQKELTPSLVDKFRGYLEIVEKETGRCAQIISGLLSFSRKSSPVFAPVPVSDLMDRCILLSRHKLELANIVLTYDVAPDIPPVLGDFNQLQQCIINLIFNAADVMPRGGTLTLGARYDAAAHQVTFLVKDTGPGISPKDLPHIFEPFYTTKSEGHGVGLGLSTVFGIAERHKGSICAESRPGEGATFFLTLPCAAPLPANAPAG
ncbi:MAG: response regulator [Desulfobacterales bacterium]|jgi:PAS domain S-box-containing protein|nr:response regulator [Desulfobacterales bacterium]